MRFQAKIGNDEVYKKAGKKAADVAKDMESLDSEDTSFNINLLSRQIAEEAVELTKDMSTYQTGAFQFNNKQWLVQKVNYKLESAGLHDFFDSDKKKNDLLKILDDFMSNKINSIYIDASNIGIGDGVGAMIVDLISNYVINNKKKDNNAFVC